jgi:hypothetical protein
MALDLTDRNGASVGIFGTEEEAKEFVPGVKEWRRGQDGIPGWYGFLSDEPFSQWDYKITLTPGGRGGSVSENGSVSEDPQSAVVRHRPQDSAP